MKAKRILFSTDFSPSSDAGLEHATGLARGDGGALLIVHVAEPPSAYVRGETYYGISEPDQTALLNMLHAVRPSDATVPCKHLLMRGDPARTIVEVADLEKCDLIVMGTHGRTGLGRLLMGSVAEAVMRQANCPVLTYKLPSQPAERKCSETRLHVEELCETR